MSQNVYQSFPNKIVAQPTSPGSTDWFFVGVNTTTRALSFRTTLAAIRAAGEVSYPGLDVGGKIGVCLITSKTSTGADGSPVQYRLNATTLPTGLATAENVVDGSGQQISVACPFRTIAVKMNVSSDVLILDGAH